jgi:hypothetical protein
MPHYHESYIASHLEQHPVSIMGFFGKWKGAPVSEFCCQLRDIHDLRDTAKPGHIRRVLTVYCLVHHIRRVERRRAGRKYVIAPYAVSEITTDITEIVRATLWRFPILFQSGLLH